MEQVGAKHLRSPRPEASGFIFLIGSKPAASGLGRYSRSASACLCPLSDDEPASLVKLG